MSQHTDGKPGSKSQLRWHLPLLGLLEHELSIQAHAKPDLRRLIALQGVKLLKTDNQPAVYGEWLHAKSKHTVLLYGHYDVQPAEPLELWESPAFEPHISKGLFLGRGVSDDKGGLLQPIQACACSLLSVQGQCVCKRSTSASLSNRAGFERFLIYYG